MALEEDKEFAAEVLEWVIEDQNNKPRSLQRGIGPSELGGCRERLRATWQGDPEEPDPYWHVAAHVGTVMGDDLERIFKTKGAMTQVSVTTKLPQTGLEVSGHADVVWPGRNRLGDLKSKDGLAGVRYEGVSLEYGIQLGVYALGLVQMGVLQEGCDAVLLYYDRAGNDLEFAAAVIPWEGLMRFVEIAELRLQQVVAAQEALDSGDTEPLHDLRDKPPSFCFSAKVMCPFRTACWSGSEYDSNTVIDDESIMASAARYKEGRELEKRGASMKREARAELSGITGQLADGTRVGWGPKGISVT